MLVDASLCPCIREKNIHGYYWREKPIDQGIVYRVEELAYLEKQPLHSNNHPLFEWLSGSGIEVGNNEDFIDV